MDNPKIIEIMSLPEVSNICDQQLREVISLPAMSLAHVLMDRGSSSLLHKHSRMTEIYFVMQGRGVLTYGDKKLEMAQGAYQVIPPTVPHQLINTGLSCLEHVVLAIPPFDDQDIVIVEGNPGTTSCVEKFEYDQEPIEAADGALIYELMSKKQRKELGVALAYGLLPPGKKATPHYHKKSEELYIIVEGEGKAMIENQKKEVQKGSLIYLPVDTIHALENESSQIPLKVLCISSPAYSAPDFWLDKT